MNLLQVKKIVINNFFFFFTEAINYNNTITRNCDLFCRVSKGPIYSRWKIIFYYIIFCCYCSYWSNVIISNLFWIINQFILYCLWDLNTKIIIKKKLQSLVFKPRFETRTLEIHVNMLSLNVTHKLIKFSSVCFLKTERIIWIAKLRHRLSVKWWRKTFFNVLTL